MDSAVHVYVWTQHPEINLMEQARIEPSVIAATFNLDMVTPETSLHTE